MKTQTKLEDIIQILKEESLRVTKTRLAVAEVLLSSKDLYLSPEDIFKKILNKKNISCDQVSVYRILAKYEEIGLLKKSEFHSNASRYILNESLGSEHRHEHYFKCVECFSIESFNDCFVASKEKELEAIGYTNLKHHVEITGICPGCS
jgi:Fe2+ or Zn2+ uptake regulation protein